MAGAEGVEKQQQLEYLLQRKFGNRAGAEGVENKKLLQHILLIKFRPGVTDKKINEIVAQWADLQKIIKEIKRFSWGKDISEENMQQGFTHVFELLFENLEDVNKYLYNPDHVYFKDNILLPNCAGVVVVDFYPIVVKP